ncbi:MAG: FAD-binding oxidoreductase [Dehalococcoidia bacterium]|nr:FAD-binding oxidoreductase [Dehalococcoidia bacterium]
MGERALLVERLMEIAGADRVVSDRDLMQSYLLDETSTLISPQPAADLVLVKPESAQEVSRVLAFANSERVPVFPRGGGTGLCGGAVPTRNGIILSLERMNDLRIDRENLMAVAGAGVTLGELVERVQGEGLFFPPHPGDDTAQIGGLVACNAGGSRAVKYGVMRNYVKGIEAVLPSGEVLRLGGALLKDNTGYSLMHLLMGSEGTLAVITEATLRLFPAPAATATMVIPYMDRHAALNTVPELLRSGITPLAIEYLDRRSAETSAAFLGTEWPCKTGEAFLMIIVDSMSQDEVNRTCQEIARIGDNHGGLEPLIGQTKKEQEKVLRIRSNVYTSLKNGLADALDISVPPASLGKLMDAIDRVADRFAVEIPMCGHAGDGNLHPALLKESFAGSEEDLKRAKRAIYEEAARLGGVMTGEHGLGKVRPPDLGLFLNGKRVELMRAIKRVFDPEGILNPGCVIGEHCENSD